MTDPLDDAKCTRLTRRGALHPHPDRVTDPVFHDDHLFDAGDAVQVKYEMLRAVRVEGRSASQAAQHVGFSRPRGPTTRTRRARSRRGFPAGRNS